jgi:hypothetical protein
MSATVADFPQPASERELAIYRWTLGHRAFHLYLIAMVTLLAELDRAEAPDEARTTCILRDLATLFEATSACMKYSSDFGPDVYDSAIRPSMEPPMCKPGFSGSLNVDHKRMMVALVGVPDLLERRFGEDTATWPPLVLDAWQTLVGAEQRARFDHGHICRRLVPSGPSLLRLHKRGEKDSRPPSAA